VGCKIKVLRQLLMALNKTELPTIKDIQFEYKNGRVVGISLKIECGKTPCLKLIKKG
jgi:ABC-type polysaccharide/polyol phosphate transport system ATPase subunit